ncbi:PilZ domain-containing protein [Thiocystis violascens]|uniref:PilZ domain-containing protein n=1 Tax=Thiocystis violascens (strain ATCC 17096 / DSM 198 / 6111) TaxID=765911 RepID=I3Y5V5_THIV6|nr:PilZ domain-containing protein [Thiocystis violascens]AFL72373.1 PilZ domain-containing protein [Thiocystis violascens DSM 198]
MKLRDEERRDFMRLATEADASVTRLATGLTLLTRLVNLSASGCAFFAETPMEQGEEIEFTVQGTSKRIEPLKRVGRVVRVTQGEASYLIAVEFLIDPD